MLKAKNAIVNQQLLLKRDARSYAKDHLIGSYELLSSSLIEPQIVILGAQYLIGKFQIAIAEERRPYTCFEAHIISAKLKALFIIMAVNFILNVRYHDPDAPFDQQRSIKPILIKTGQVLSMYKVDE